MDNRNDPKAKDAIRDNEVTCCAWMKLMVGRNGMILICYFNISIWLAISANLVAGRQAIIFKQPAGDSAKNGYGGKFRVAGHTGLINLDHHNKLRVFGRCEAGKRTYVSTINVACAVGFGDLCRARFAGNFVLFVGWVIIDTIA